MSHPYIAREGWIHVGLITALCLVLSVTVGYWSIPAWILWLFVLQFFRDPEVSLPASDVDANRMIVSPANGRVVALVETKDPYDSRRCLLVSVFMNVFSIHSNRIPIGGRVTARHYHHGKFLNAALDKSSTENERNGLVIELADSRRVTVVQIAGLIARRILCYVDENDAVETGQRYGFIRFGSRVDLYLPIESTIKVSLGDKVGSGTSLIATLP